ncbi:MAG: DUF4013 domain-containing protein [Verrucomicrobiales bacterium]|nr:DUF4013 domain-containing protein [Verrucomicrobiales bacterium]
MSISLGAALKDIFKTEKKWMTILGLSVCTLIPIIGPIVSMGFVIRRMARERCGHEAEDFEFNFFGEYLKFGLWPFLATFVLSLVMIPLMVVLMVPMMIGAGMAEGGTEEMGVILAIVGFFLYFGAIILMMLFSFPVMLRSGLMMDFKSGFSWGFIGSFIKKVGLSLIGYYILLVLILMPMSILGSLALFVGVYVVAAWIQVAMNHILFQHYDLYLERGGEPIQFAADLVKELEAPPLPNQGNTSPGPLPTQAETDIPSGDSGGSGSQP